MVEQWQMKWTYLAQTRTYKSGSPHLVVGLTTNLSGVFLLVSQAYHQHVSSIFRFWEEVAWSQREATEMWVAFGELESSTVPWEHPFFLKGQE